LGYGDQVPAEDNGEMRHWAYMGFGFSSFIVIVALVQGSMILMNRNSGMSVVTPDIVPSVTGGKTVLIQISVVNSCNKPIRILGANVPCNCSMIRGLPITIEPKKAKVLEVEYYAPVLERQMEKEVEIILFHSRGDHRYPFRLTFDVHPVVLSDLEPVPDPSIR
jgi:hypothetical protein